MPLSKLFHKRNSLKNKAEAQLTAKEISELKSKACEDKPSDRTENAITKTERVEDSHKTESDESSVHPDTHPRKSSASSEDSQHGCLPESKSAPKQTRNKSRSNSCKESRSGFVSCKESRSGSVPCKESRQGSVKGSFRRKFESNVVNSSTDDEGFSDRTIHLKEKDLEKVIGQYVDKLIRDSIVSAVKSVDIDNLCQEVIKDVSSRSQSESSDGAPGTVEQKLRSRSVTDYVELKVEDAALETKDYSNSEESSCEDDKTNTDYGRHDHVLGQNNCDEGKGSKKRDDGYQADVEESESCMSLPTLSSSDEMKVVKDGVRWEETSSDESKNAGAESDCLVETPRKDSDLRDGDIEEQLNVAETLKEVGDSTPSQESIDPKETEKDVEDSSILKETANENSDNSNVEQVDAEDRTEHKKDRSKSKDSEDSESPIHPKESEKGVEDSSILKETTDEDSDNSNVEQVDAEDRTEHKRNLSKSKGSEDFESPIHPKESEKDVDDSSILKETTDEDSDNSNVEQVDAEDRTEHKRDRSNSKDSEDSESLAVEEYERKETLKAPDQPDLILMSAEVDGESHLNKKRESLIDEPIAPATDLVDSLPQKTPGIDDEKKINWKKGYLHVKLPHKARGKGHLKVWKKRCVAFQADEFSHDPRHPSLMMGVYSSDSSKPSATFWRSVGSGGAVVYRSSSRSQRYAFTVAEDGKPLLHLAAECETDAQDWMAAARAILWPPSPVVQLEKMLNGSEFEVSLIDNEFSYRAGLLGMYGYLSITPKKLILVHPNQGYVIQEWYLNTVDRFQLVQQTRIEDVHKVLAMTTCSDSSTGKGEILIYCTEAVALLQSLASTIHQILTYHSSQEGGIYQKELEAMAEWLIVSNTEENENKKAPAEEYYKVPRQVKSLLDIPNFIFDKPLASTSTSGSEASLDPEPPGSPDHFLNCSITSFQVGGEEPTGRTSDSELSDSYTPPQSPVTKTKKMIEELTNQH